MSVTWPLIDVEDPPLGIDSNQVVSAIEQARRDLLFTFAEGVPLSVLGQNVGIPRPPQLPDDDAMMRRLIRLLAHQPKVINFAVYHLLSAIMGSQSEIIANSLRPWRIYEVNANEIIIELPLDLIGTSNENASYLHGPYGYGAVVSGPSNTFTTPGDLSVASATTLVGKNLRFNTAVGVWTDYTVNSSTYSAITGLSTVVVSAATVPAGGGYFYIEIPGDLTSSYRGDYLASGGFVTSFVSAGGPPTSTLDVRGDITQHVDTDDAVSVYNGTTVVSTTIVTISAYVSTTNTTQVTIGLIAYTGTSTSVGVGTLTDATQSFVVNELTGGTLKDSAGLYYPILSNTATVITVTGNPTAGAYRAYTATTVSGGLVNALFLRELEEADTLTTPPHNDRVYLTGLGLFEVFQYYFDLLVRAAGIVVRVELI
jgi:hypothetical protein